MRSSSLAFKKLPIPDTYFAYTITTSTGTPVQISRSQKDKPGYLQFMVPLILSPEHQATISTLTKDQIEQITQEIAIELDKTRVGFTIASMSIPQTGNTAVAQMQIILQKAGAIQGLSEAVFATYVDDMEFTTQLTRAATALSLRRLTASHVVGRAASVGPTTQ